MASSLKEIPKTSKHLLLFGDASGEKLSAIRELVRNSKTIPAARRFLQEATDVIRYEFSQVSRYDHGWEGDLDSLLSIAEKHEEEHGDNTIVSIVLSSIGRLGKLIVYADEDPSILGSPVDPVEIIALCSGLLPATVAVVAEDTSQLFSLSREIISVSFRLGLEARRRMKLIEDAPFQSWGRTYTGLSMHSVQDILDKFHENQNVPRLRKVAIGVVAENWLTLIGPPSSLAALESWSSDIRTAPQLETQVPGPIHSNCLPQVDTATLLGNSPLLNQPINISKAHMISPGRCKSSNHVTLGSLLEEVVQDIAHNVLHVTETIQGCVKRLDGNKQVVKLSVMGPTNYLAALKSELKVHGIEYDLNHIAVQDEMTQGGSDLVAIVGMSGRFPDNDTVEGFWEDLLASKCHIKEVPKTRFDINDFETPARHGAWLDKPGLFDHRLFNISPREAAQMDPGHRLMLTISYEALQSAGYTPDGASGRRRIATYLGQAQDEWAEILNQRGADIYYVPGGSRAFGPARLNYHYKWSGGSYALDSACSTSLTAIQLACSALINREIDMALAGGVSVFSSPFSFAGLWKAGMLSGSGGCRTYHDDADGYARGEGGGVVVLKLLKDAEADNDNILGVIRGSARTYCSTSTSMTRPDAASQQATYSQVLRQASVDPSEIAYVEMHGTGTQAGDEVEMTSVINTLAKRRLRDNPLIVGAVKAAVGHGEGAAGVISLIKVIMMLREGVIPPQPGWPFKLNQKFPPLADSNVRIATKRSTLRSSPKGDKRVKILVNSFDATGGNVSLLIAEAPLRQKTAADPRSWHLVAVSARTAVSLQKNRERLLDFLETYPETKLADLAYTTTARRIHESLRCAYIGASTRDIVRQLRDDVKRQSDVPKTKSRTQSCVFLCSGQSSHYAGMGSDLFRECPTFRESLLAYQEMAKALGLPQFVDLISQPGLDISSQSTTQVQLAIVAFEIAMAHVMKTWGITPDVVIGHSLGEYAALAIAGVLSVSDVLLLVGSRGALMEKHLTADSHAMLVTNVTERSLEQLFKELELDSCNVACVNAPSITIASGIVSDIERLQKHMETEGTRTTLLQVPYGFHSSQVEPILGELENTAKGVVFSEPKIPIVSTLTGQVERGASAFSPAYIVQQTRQKVMFVGALEAGRAAGLYDETSLFVECGAKPSCLGLVRQTLDVSMPYLLPTSNPGENDWRTLSNIMRRAYELGVSINWPEFHKPFQNSLSLISLPFYAFDSRDFWTPYVPPTPSSKSAGTIENFRATLVTPKPDELGKSSLRHVDEEIVDGNTITATLTSPISNPHLLEAIEGHVVNGQTICPLAVFHDLALSAAKYSYGRMHPAAKLPDMALLNIDISHALVVGPTTHKSHFFVTSSYCVEDNSANIKFQSKLGDKITFHGKCQVAFDQGGPAWMSGLSQTLFLLNSRIDVLRDQASRGKAHRLLKPVVYTLFSNLVSYSSRYQALEEVIMDSTCNDAIGTVKLPDVPGSDYFHQSPYTTDAVTHLAGFVLNSSIRYSPDTVCLAVGFDTWRSVTELSPGQTYTSYVCMQEVPNSHMVSGDCYVFSGKDLVQATLGLKFLRIKRIAMNTILGIAEPPHTKTSLAEPNKSQDKNLGVVTSKEDAPIVKKPLIDETDQRQKSSKSVEAPGSGISETISSILSIVVAESGCSLQDMTDDTRYVDLGVDSLMAIAIVTITSRNIGLDLPVSFFMENETIGESKMALKAYLKTQGKTDEYTRELGPASSDESDSTPLLNAHTPDSLVSSRPPSVNLGQDSSPVIEAVDMVLMPPNQPAHRAKVVYYQGPRSPGSDKLFFLADETGSTFGYIHLPSLGSDLAIYGVDSPFAKNPVDMNLDVKQLASLYRAAIQTQQPHGPYMLGGIATGAVLAFEVARGLLEAGEGVRALLILDSASPKFNTNDSADGNSGGNSISRGRSMKPVQEEHFRKTLSIFAAYIPTPLAPSQKPRVSFQIMAKNDNQKQSESPIWAECIPGLRTRESNIESGLFLKTSRDELGQICKEAIELAREC